MRSVTVVFPSNSSRYYDYFTRENDDPKVGDYIITSFSTYTDAGAINFAKVSSISEVASDKATKFYLQHVSIETLRENEKANLELVQKNKEKRNARIALDKLIEKKSKELAYQALATEDEEAKRLVTILNS